MSDFLQDIKQALNNRFNLQEDKADEHEIIASLRKNVDFRGANLWALVFAILIASIGLNVNSTAIITGAMLISPLMGPVMGIGLGIGINDLALVKRGAKNLLVATVISIFTSYVYFLVTPLHEIQSELLARTSPSIWDVFIAFFGGLVGMVAASRKEKNNVIPGVAIATALMPPLCTAGFGLAMGNWYFVLGAFYLYFINSVFISIATFMMARYLKLQRTRFDDARVQKKVTTYLIIVSLITILPSIYMAYRIVNRSIFESNARKYIDEQFHFDNTQVVSKAFSYSRKGNSIDLLLIGSPLESRQIDSLKKNLDNYNLTGVGLNIRQGLNAKQQLDLSQIKASILEDVFSRQASADTGKKTAIVKPRADSNVLAEIKILFPAVQSFGVTKMGIHRADTNLVDTQRVAFARFKTPLPKNDEAKLRNWLQKRYQSPDLKLVTQ